MKDYILDIVHLNNDFTGNGMYMALYFITLLFIAFYLKDKRLKNAILYPSLILLVGIYLCAPAVNRFVFSFYDDEVRGRFSWLFMVPAIAAMGCVLMVRGAKEKKQQILLTVAIIPVIFLSGVFQITDYRFPKAENLYKLPQVCIDIADDILAEQRNEGDGVARLIVPYETAYAFRQYDTDIELMFGEDATYGRIWDLRQAALDSVAACETMVTSCPDMEVINIAADHYGMEYIVFDCTYTDFGLESINDMGYTEDEDFVGDRTPDPGAVERMSSNISIADGPGNGEGTIGKGTKGRHWDLDAYGLEYMGTYERYLLYRYRRDK
ncbi:MAG: hypothetical protein K6G27_03220 [Lachnospiraceae bacterium]|nr:hypothetical protein [Lachnospiraceae bacterium]